MGFKICSKCKVSKPLNDFNIDKSRKFGVTCACKKCRHPFRKEKLVVKDGYKECSRCGEEKTIGSFNNVKKNPSGISYSCKECLKSSASNSEKIKIPNITGYKKCPTCKNSKSVVHFYEDKSTKDLLSYKCIQCKSDSYQNKREEILQKRKADYPIRQIRLKKKREELKLVNSEAKINKALEKEDSRNRVIVKRKIKNLIMSSFKRALDGGYKKSKRTEEILGCSPYSFKKHIEAQFENWMNWDNHGNCEGNEYRCTWDLDHIIPISFAKTEDDIYKLNHWSNFQPLCSRVNRFEKKSNIVSVTNLELKITIIKLNKNE